MIFFIYLQTDWSVFELLIELQLYQLIEMTIIQDGNEQKISNKELIVKIAYGLFLKKGYNAVSIKDIMEASTISKGGIYHHFESKESILVAVLDQYFFKELTMDESQFDGLTFKERIKIVFKRAVRVFAMVESVGKNGIKYPIRRLFQFQLECENFPEIRNQFRETSQAYTKNIEQIVSEGIRNGEVEKELDPETLSFQIIGMIEGIAIHNSTAKKDISLLLMEKYEKVFESYFRFICPKK